MEKEKSLNLEIDAGMVKITIIMPASATASKQIDTTQVSIHKIADRINHQISEHLQEDF